MEAGTRGAAPARILIVDDEPAVRESLAGSLEFEGYQVAEAADGVMALDRVEHARPDLVVLDVLMPRMDGLTTCRRLRAAGATMPVLMLTARDMVGDRVTGLDAGADDYLAKPFELDELLARVRALLRRGAMAAAAGPAPADVLAFDDLRMDTLTREVTRDGRPLGLTRTEYMLLEMFLAHPRQVLTREQILETVWRNERFRGELSRALAECRPDATTTASGFRPPGPEMIQLVTADGKACTVPNAGAINVTEADRQVARGERESASHDGTGEVPSGGRTDVRVLTQRFDAAGGVPAAASFAIPLDEVQGPLDGLALLLTAVSALGVLVSAGAGLAIARASLRPVDRLTDLVEHIARTEDLDTRIPDEGADEIARLSRSFNSMTTALAASRDRQQQLIADAGHELRTPRTSLRTNIDLLLRSEATGRDLPAGTRHNLLVSVKAQMRELSSLVGDLLEQETVALHDVVERAVGRARLRGPELTVRVETRPWYVSGDPASLERRGEPARQRCEVQPSGR